MHTLFTLIRKIFGDVEVGVLGRFDQICVNFEGKGSEVSIVDSSTLNDLFPDILSQSFDDKMELRLGIKGFDWFVGPGLGWLVLSWVILSMADDPTWQETYQA